MKGSRLAYRSSHARRTAAAVLAVALACAMAWPAGVVSAKQLPTDLIGGKPAGSSSRLMRSAPDLSAPAGILVTSDGRQLWAREPDARRAMASITKIMTALVVLQEGGLGREITVTAADTRVGESEAGIEPGDKLTVESLLQAMLIKSANEAAMALARGTAGSVDAFMAKMNAKAAQLGLKGTSFENPHGLDGPKHHTTAADLAVLARAAMATPGFREIVTRKRITLTGTNGRRTYEATDELLKGYLGAEGIKTGFTNDAGYSFVGAAKRGRIELISVILGARTNMGRFTQTKRLLDWGFNHYKDSIVATIGTPAGSVPVSDYLDLTVPAVVGSTAATPVFDLAGPTVGRFEVVGEVTAPVKQGQRLGTYTVSQEGTTLVTVPVVAARGVEAPGAWEAFTIWWTRLWRSMTGGRTRARPEAPPPLAPAVP